MQNQSVIKAMQDAQELAHRNNENEAVWNCFEKKRALRHRFIPPLPLLESILDDLDWQAAERECRKVRAIGNPYP